MTLQHADNGFLIEARDLVKRFRVKTPLGEKKQLLTAVDGVSFGVRKDGVFALVGESGCGKSTVARLLLRLLDPTSGAVLYKGTDIASRSGNDLTAFRRAAQIIFQDPFAALNPRMRIGEVLAEPFRIHKLAPGGELRARATALLEQVGMGSDALSKYPHEFSGGQRQRICIARALALSPELIIADEPLSSLDVSIQAQIITLLQEIRKKTAASFVFISHDLRVVRYFSDEVAVMYLGRIVEQGPTESIFASPRHPYTELLLSSAPKLVVRTAGPAPGRRTAAGDVPSPIDIPSGCPFHPRCPKRFEPCDRERPALRPAQDVSVACHLY
jgi:oligopeptide/dipeptide ABC transporter ATP-binding protein